jgi:hypothetical protein
MPDGAGLTNKKFVLERILMAVMDSASRLFITRLGMWNHNRVALALPDVLTAGTRDGLRGMFLFQRFLTDRTISLPHIHALAFLVLGIGH